MERFFSSTLHIKLLFLFSSLNIDIKNKELHLWDLRTYELAMRYTGHTQEKFLIRCDFGGPNDSFIVCGSEGIPKSN